MGILSPAAKIHHAPSLGDYLTDEKRLLRVIGYNAADVLCDDVGAPCDEPTAVVTIVADLLPKWRVVIPTKENG